MNLPNILTVARTVFTFIAAALLCMDVRFFALAAAVLYIRAGATDWFDGYIARKYDMVTTFGKFMDALSDKIMVVTMFMTLFALGCFRQYVILCLFCAVISIAREFLVSGIRMIASKAGIVQAAEKLGKYKAGFQMYALGAIIAAQSLRVDFHAEGSILDMLLFYSGVVTLIISTVLSVISGWTYTKRYWHLLKG